MGNKNTLLIICLGNFLSSIAMNQIIPLLPFIMQEFHVSEDKISLYSGLAFGASTFIMALFAPIWGILADKYGRKKMMLRSAFGMGCSLIISAFLSSAESFIILRCFMGLFSGFSSACVAFIALNTSKEESNYALAKLSSFQISGSLLGPLFGGVLMHFFSFRLQFLISGILLILIFFLILFNVKEEHIYAKSSNKLKLNKVQIIIICILCIATFFLQSALHAIGPTLGLFVSKITDYKELGTGFCYSLTGIASAIFAPKLSKYAKAFGEIKLILISLFALLICFILHFYAINNFTFLCFVRFITGISFCSLMPSIYSLIKASSPHEIGSKIFGINQSFLGFGMFFGSVSGGYFYNIFDAGIFFICAFFIFINIILFTLAYKYIKII